MPWGGDIQGGSGEQSVVVVPWGGSPLIRRGESAYGPEVSLDSPGRVWKRDMANMRSVYQKPRRKLGFDGRKRVSKVKDRHPRSKHCSWS